MTSPSGETGPGTAPPTRTAFPPGRAGAGGADPPPGGSPPFFFGDLLPVRPEPGQILDLGTPDAPAGEEPPPPKHRVSPAQGDEPSRGGQQVLPRVVQPPG